jgi:outer membrane receptor protein involved in Fe transport
MYFSSDDYIAGPTEGLLREDVRYQEHALEISAHQLLGDGFSFGARYRLAYADLRRGFPDYPNRGFGDLPDSSEWKGWLHTIQLQGIYRHHTGVFTRAEGIFLGQDRKQDGVAMASDDLWQVNLIAGYRFPRNQAEVSVGLLNVFDENYRLDPINAYAELPRSRTFYARLILNF